MSSPILVSGFVMAQEAHEKELTSDLAFSTTVWALLVATLASPIVFRRLIKASTTKRNAEHTEVMANDTTPVVGTGGKGLAIGSCVDDGGSGPGDVGASDSDRRECGCLGL